MQLPNSLGHKDICHRVLEVCSSNLPLVAGICDPQKMSSMTYTIPNAKLKFERYRLKMRNLRAPLMSANIVTLC